MCAVGLPHRQSSSLVSKYITYESRCVWFAPSSARWCPSSTRLVCLSIISPAIHNVLHMCPPQFQSRHLIYSLTCMHITLVFYLTQMFIFLSQYVCLTNFIQLFAGAAILSFALLVRVCFRAMWHCWKYTQVADLSLFQVDSTDKWRIPVSSQCVWHKLFSHSQSYMYSWRSIMKYVSCVCNNTHIETRNVQLKCSLTYFQTSNTGM